MCKILKLNQKLKKPRITRTFKYWKTFVYIEYIRYINILVYQYTMVIYTVWSTTPYYVLKWVLTKRARGFTPDIYISIGKISIISFILEMIKPMTFLLVIISIGN